MTDLASMTRARVRDPLAERVLVALASISSLCSRRASADLDDLVQGTALGDTEDAKVLGLVLQVALDWPRVPREEQAVVNAILRGAGCHELDLAA